MFFGSHCSFELGIFFENLTFLGNRKLPGNRKLGTTELTVNKSNRDQLFVSFYKTVTALDVP